MTTDQLLPGQRAHAEPFLSDNLGWGLGLAVVNKRVGLGESIGTYTWAGGLGSTWANDPNERLTTILLTQAAWSSPVAFDIINDFTTAAYAAIDD